ncbi:hypothetical protein AO398_15285 [Methylobacterium sp. GXS13]|nr:hypothetical protein AO398_15285 [Methylobacterium sp. GXS13]
MQSVRTMSTEFKGKTHIDIFDRVMREEWAQRFGVSEERLRKAVTMVGSRITSVAAYLDKPAS